MKLGVFAAAFGAAAGTIGAMIAGPFVGTIIGFIFAFPLPIAGVAIIGVAACFSWVFAVWAAATLGFVAVAFILGAVRKPSDLADRLIGGVRSRPENTELAPRTAPAAFPAAGARAAIGPVYHFNFFTPAGDAQAALIRQAITGPAGDATTEGK